MFEGTKFVRQLIAKIYEDIFVGWYLIYCC